MQNPKYLLIPLFLFIVGCSFESKTLVTINDSKYTVADLEERFQFTAADDSVKIMEKVGEFINHMVVVEEAKLMGYEDDPVVSTAFETNREEVIWRTYYNDVILSKVKVRDSEVRDLYSNIVEQYHLAQIVVAEESLANYVYAQFEKGITFEDLLMFSLDTISNDGDIGTFSVISIPPEIMEALENVKEGGATKPVKFGEYYLIFKVVEHSIADSPKYEEVEANIRQSIWQEKARAEGESYYNKIRERAKVEYNPEGLEILAKPESLVTDEDLDTWVVKKHDSEYVYVRSVIDAVRYLRTGASVNPQYLIDQELIPDLIYDEAVKNHHDKRTTTKKKLQNTMSTLLYQKYYSDMVVEKAYVDSMEVVAYYRSHRDEFEGKNLNQAFSIVQARLRDARVESLRTDLFAMLREKHKPEVNEAVLAQLLKEER